MTYKLADAPLSLDHARSQEGQTSSEGIGITEASVADWRVFAHRPLVVKTMQRAGSSSRLGPLAAEAIPYPAGS